MTPFAEHQINTSLCLQNQKLALEARKLELYPNDKGLTVVLF